MQQVPASRDSGSKARVRRLDEKCQCRSPSGTTSPKIFPSCLYALTDQLEESWKDFPEPENEEVLTEYRALPLADPPAVEEVEDEIWTPTLNASRCILLRNKQHKTPKSQVKGRRNRLKWIEARSCVQSKVGKEKLPTIKKVIANMPLHSGKDKMTLVLLTLEHMENLSTMHAITKYRVGLGGGPCVNFLKDKKQEGSTQPARAKGQMYQALELYEIMNVESVFGGLYS